MKTQPFYTIVLLTLLLALAACRAQSNQVSEAAVDTPAVQEADTAEPTESLTEVPPTEAPTEVPPTPTEAPPTDTPEPAGTLEYVANHGGQKAGDWDEQNMENYNALHPQLTIDYTRLNLYSNPVPTTLYRLVADSTPPDVMSGFVVGNLRAHVAQGQIADISDLWQEQGWDDAFPESVKEMVAIDGKQYFVPHAMQWNPIWYRTDIFDEVGLVPPETWEALLAACDTLHEAGYIPVAVSNTGWTPPIARWFTSINMRLNGPAFHEALMQGEERYDDPRLRQVFEHLVQLFQHNCFSEEQTGYQGASDQIFEGEAAMYNLGEWLSESDPEGKLPETLDFFSFPVINPDVPRGEIVHVYGAYMLAQADNPTAARDFLAYWGSVESQTSMVETLGRVAAHLEVDESLYNDVYQRGLEFVAEADHLTQLLEFNTDPQMAGTILSELERFWQDPGPENIDPTIEILEERRQLVYGE